MSRSRKSSDPIPENFNSIEEAAEFWDTHSVADYWDSTPEVHFAYEPDGEQHLVAVQPVLMHKIQALSTAQRIAAQTLINLWLAEKVAETPIAAE